MMAVLIVPLFGVGCGPESSDRTRVDAPAASAGRADRPSGTGDPRSPAGDLETAAGDRDPPLSDPGRDRIVTGDEAESLPVGDWEPNATVERVVDGDTLIAEIGGRSESIRLIGIDTPESVARSRPVECYGTEAALRLQELLPPGTAVTLLRDAEGRDAYDRLLGYVVRSSDGLFINLELIASGYAVTLNFPPNDQFADALALAESEAMTARRGLWGVCGGPDVPVE